MTTHDRFLPQASDAFPYERGAERVHGVPFIPIGPGQDTGKCGLCGELVDVGLELREHTRLHGALTEAGEAS